MSDGDAPGDSIRCPACGTGNPDGARFCMECARPLEPDCAQCGAALPAQARFCPQCAAPVEGNAPSRPETPPVPSAFRDRTPRDYTPRHIAEKILTSRAALQGERKQVTVLFADVQGSLALSDQIGPEAWHGVLEDFFRIVASAVHRFEGTINQYTGDGVMALFGAPISHEDHAQRACHASLLLLEELRRFSDELRLSAGINFAVRLGLNSGEVVVGRIGDDLRMDYTAYGHTVGLASRMEEIAAADRAYMTENTASLVQGFFQLRPLGGTEVKGVTEPVQVYELMGVGRLRTRFDLSRSRGLSRFVGRANEMAELEGALERVQAGVGQVVGVVANPGVGKSRLCFEFAERCQARDIPVRTAHCVSHGRMLAFLPIRELLHDFFEIGTEDTDHEIRRKIAGEVLLLDSALAEELPLLFDFMRVPDPNQPLPAMDPGQRQSRLFEAFLALIRVRDAGRPSVFLIEDMHWVDPSTDELVARMVESAAGSRVLLVLNFRPEYRTEWMTSPVYRRLALRHLDDEAIAGLVADLLGNDSSLAGLAERIRETSAGNPFFIEEIVRSLVEAGTLAGSPGRHRLDRPLDDLALPASLQALLASRIDRLAEGPKAVLQTAAVLGKRVPGPVLHAMTDGPVTDLETSLRQLCDAEFLYPETVYPTTQYAFVHPLTQEVAYRSTLARVRAELHEKAAEVIADQPAPSEAERASLLAYHWGGAGKPLVAAEHHLEAAEQLLIRFGDAAFGHYRRAIELARDSGRSPRAIDIGIRACARLLDWAGRMRVNRAQLTRLYAWGEELARESGDEGRQTRIASSYSVFEVWQGVIGDAVAPLEAAVGMGSRLGTLEEEVNALYHLGLALYFGGRVEEAIAIFQKAIDLQASRASLEDAVAEHPEVAAVVGPCMALLGHARLDRGELGAARAIIRRVQRLNERESLVVSEASGRAVESLSWLALGETERALEAAVRAVSLAQGSSLRTAPVDAYRALGAARLAVGDAPGAAEAATNALEISNETDPGLVTGTPSRIILSQARASMGQAEEGLRDADRALADSRSRGYALIRADAHMARAGALLAIGGDVGLDEAEGELQAARAHSEEIGRVLVLPDIAQLGARLALARGAESVADERLDEARAMLRSMGAVARAERLSL